MFLLSGCMIISNISRALFSRRSRKLPKFLTAQNSFSKRLQATREMKYVLVTGGVISGVGKGVIASSIGTLLNCCGISVTSLKIDPYINIDAGTFSPYEHGEFAASYERNNLKRVEVDLSLRGLEGMSEGPACDVSFINRARIFFL